MFCKFCLSNVKTEKESVYCVNCNRNLNSGETIKTIEEFLSKMYEKEGIEFFGDSVRVLGYLADLFPGDNKEARRIKTALEYSIPQRIHKILNDEQSDKEFEIKKLKKYCIEEYDMTEIVEEYIIGLFVAVFSDDDISNYIIDENEKNRKEMIEKMATQLKKKVQEQQKANDNNSISSKTESYHKEVAEILKYIDLGKIQQAQDLNRKYADLGNPYSLGYKAVQNLFLYLSKAKLLNRRLTKDEMNELKRMLARCNTLEINSNNLFLDFINGKVDVVAYRHSFMDKDANVQLLIGIYNVLVYEGALSEHKNLVKFFYADKYSQYEYKDFGDMYDYYINKKKKFKSKSIWEKVKPI